MAPTIESIPLVRPVENDPLVIENLCLDAGYDKEMVRELGQLCGYTLHIVPRDKEARELKKLRQAGKKARRWVVERSHSWFNRFRALLVRWEKKAENYLAELHLACAIIAFRAAGLVRQALSSHTESLLIEWSINRLFFTFKFRQSFLAIALT
jgi:transposase